MNVVCYKQYFLKENYINRLNKRIIKQHTRILRIEDQLHKMYVPHKNNKNEGYSQKIEYAVIIYLNLLLTIVGKKSIQMDL